MNQLNLLDYTPPMETIEPNPTPIAQPTFTPEVGSSVQVMQVQTLPQSLIGQVGLVCRIISPGIVQVEIEGQIWTVPTGNLKLIPKSELPYGLRLWYEAKCRHYDRVIEKLSASKNQHHYTEMLTDLRHEHAETLRVLEVAS